MPKSFKEQVVKLGRKHMQGDQLDRFASHYFSGATLSKQDTEVLQNMTEIFSIYAKHPSKIQAVTIFARQKGYAESSCFNILRKAIDFFGDIGETNKLGEKEAAIMFYTRVAQLAEESDKLDLAIRCRENIDKLQGLYEKDDKPLPQSVLMPVVSVVFDSDPEQLRRQQEAEVQDIEHEQL